MLDRRDERSDEMAPSRRLTLVAMIFAVAMIFIDQTIVALAIPGLQGDLHLSATGAQWIVNSYLLALSALFALGGRVADVVGHRRVVLAGVALFALFSALCGATPTGSGAEAWMVVFRALQGASAAFLFPAALAIVVDAYPVNERGRALAIFFSVSGGLTAVGPITGGYLTEWTWRAIFWINVPVALVALVLTLRARPAENRHPAAIDVPGAVLVCAGMALSVLGLQQAGTWGWDSVATWGCLGAGLAILALFVRVELRTAEPLVPIRLFADRGFRADNAVLFLLSVCFVPLFFFASLYAQVALGEDASNAGLFLLVFFGGFTIGAQRGGRVLDKRGARPTVVPGCIIAAVGFYLWGSQLDSLSLGSQWIWLGLAGLGVGQVLGPASTDALNRASRATYGAVTGVTQTVRNFAGSLGIAVLGSILITENVSRIGDTLGRAGVPPERADAIARAVSGASSGATGGGLTSGASHPLIHAVQLDFAYSTRTVVWAMAGAMLAAFVVAVVAMPHGQQAAPVEDEEAPAPVAAG
jgi:EmrB/QacA subfamily drug resistance transporter